MRTASSRPALTATSRPALTASWLRRAVPAPLPWAVRTAGRWGLLAGVAGFPCDVLLSAHSPIHDITRLPGHLADRAGSPMRSSEED